MGAWVPFTQYWPGAFHIDRHTCGPLCDQKLHYGLSLFLSFVRHRFGRSSSDGGRGWGCKSLGILSILVPRLGPLGPCVSDRHNIHLNFRTSEAMKIICSICVATNAHDIAWEGELNREARIKYYYEPSAYVCRSFDMKKCMHYRYALSAAPHSPLHNMCAAATIPRDRAGNFLLRYQKCSCAAPACFYWNEFNISFAASMFCYLKRDVRLQATHKQCISWLMASKIVSAHGRNCCCRYCCSCVMCVWGLNINTIHLQA